MTETFKELSEDEFDALYPLAPNHLNPGAGWALGEGRGCLFQTYGAELDFVRRQDPRAIWTLLDGDDGNQRLVSGYHFVNRIGYLISTVPAPEGVTIEVRIPMQTEGDADDIPGQGAERIGDFTTRERAEEVYARITGRPYGPRHESTSKQERKPL